MRTTSRSLSLPPVARAWLLGLAALAACSSGGGPDAGAADVGGTWDAGAPDSGAVSPDAGDGLAAVQLEVTVPADTPLVPPVHVVGDFQGWDPADPAHALLEIGERLHAITLWLPVGSTIEFKFARGSWDRVEKTAAGQEVPNRRLTVTGPQTHRLTVARWADGASGPRTLAGDVREVSVPGFAAGRRVWLYLPPGYDAEAPTVRHPVLYLLDGQNLFDVSTSFAGEWRVDEALEAAIPAGDVLPLIVVGIDNGGGARIDEYTPWVGTHQGQAAGGGGAAHLGAIADVLKPWVDRTYRTQPGPESTGLGGSSLGGLMAVYAAYARPDVFGRIAALSPSVWWADEELVDFVGAGARPDVRLWVDMGTAEGSLAPFRSLVAALLADGFVAGVDLESREIAGAGHNEAAWAARFPEVVRFLFPAR